MVIFRECRRPCDLGIEGYCDLVGIRLGSNKAFVNVSIF